MHPKKQHRRTPYTTSSAKIHNDRIIWSAAAMVVVGGLVSCNLHADTLTWDPGASTTGGTDGTGTWSTKSVAPTDWYDSTTATTEPVAWATGDNAIIGSGGTPGTITLGSNISAATITFDAVNTSGTPNQYTIAASGSYALTITNSSLIVNANATISAPINFSGGLVLSGADTLTLSGTDTYGTTSMQIGTGSTTAISTLAATTAGSLISGTNTIILDSGVLRYSGGGSISNVIRIADNGTTQNTSTIDAGGTTFTLNGAIQNTTTLGDNVVLQNGSMSLTSASTPTTFTTGTLEIVSGAYVTFGYNGQNNLPAQTVPITLAGQLFQANSNDGANTFNSTGDTIANNIVLQGYNATVDTGSTPLTISGVISGTQLLVNSYGSTSSLTLANANNTFSGGTIIYAGTVDISASGDLGTGWLTFQGGTLQTTAAVSDSRSIALNTGGGTINTGGYDDTFSGTISGSAGLTKTGSGILTLSGTNTYSGSTTFTGGTLSISADANLGASTGTLTFNGGTLLTSASLTDARAISLGTSGGTIDTDGTADTFSGIISGAGGLAVQSSLTGGALTLTAANTYSGGTIIKSGAIDLGTPDGGNENVNSLGTGAASINSGAALNLGGTGGSTIVVYTITNAINLNGGTIFDFDSQQHLTGAITVGSLGGTFLQQFGGKDLYIDGALSGSGAITVNHSGSSNYGTGQVHITAAGNLYNGTLSVTGGGLSIDNNTALSNANVVDDSTGSSGGVGVSGGTGVAFNGALASDTNVSVGSLAGNSTSTLSLTNGSNAVTLTIDGGASAPSSYTFAGVISGTGAIVKNGSNTLILTGTNTYSGGTTGNGGAIDLGTPDGGNENVNSLGTGAASVNSGTALNLGGTSGSIVIYTITNAINLNGGTVFDFDGQQHLAGVVNIGSLGGTFLQQFGGKDLYIDGALSGSGAITVSHSGSGNFGIGQTHITAAGNLYNGTISVTGGALSIDNNTALSNANVVDDSTASSGGSGVSGGTGVAFNGPLANDTNVSIGSLAGASTGTLSLTNGSSAVTLTIGGGTSAPSSYTFAGVISGTGAIVKTGLNTFVLSGANTYSGATTITSGTLEFTGSTASLSGNVTDNAALSFNQSANSSLSGIISGTGSVTDAGSAGTVLALSGADTYSGNTTITSGTLEFTGSTAGLSGNVTDNAALSFNQSANSSLSGIISGTGSVTEAGATGTVLTLSGANTYSGNTTVASGTTLNITGSLYQGSGHGNVLVNGTMNVANGFTVGSLTGTGALDLTNTGSPLIVTLSSIFGGAVTGDGELEAAGTGITLTLNGSLTGFTGNLLAANGGNIVVGTGAGQLASSVNLDITNNLSISLAYGNLNGNAVNFSGNTGTGGLDITGSNATGSLGAIDIATSGTTFNTIDTGGATNVLTLAGAITTASGGNTLILQNGTIDLAGTNDTTFTGGTLQIGNGTGTSAVKALTNAELPNTSVGTTVVLALDQGTLDYSGGGTLNNAINVLDNGTTASSNTLDAGTAAVTLAGSITNTSSLGNTLALQDGTFTLTGTNDATFAKGTLQIGNGAAASIAQFASANNLPGGNAGITLNLGELAYTGTGSAIVANAITDAANTNNIIDANTQQLTLSNSITNTSGALILQNGTFVLSGTNNGTGEFTGGTLQIGNGAGTSVVQFNSPSQLPAGNVNIVLSDGQLQYTGTTNSTVSSGIGLVGNDTIEATGGNTLTLSGNLTGTGGLTVESTSANGVLTLTGANTYAGTTTITSGTLELTGDTSSLTGDVVDNSALSFNQASSSSLSGVISGTGTVTEAGASGTVLTLSGTNTYTGGTAINSGTLEFTGDTSGLGGRIIDNVALVFSQAANSSLGQTVSGSGSLTQTGTATLTLSGTNTYTGNTTVNSGGTLNVTGSLYQGSGHGNVLVNGSMNVANGFTVGSLTGTGALDLTNSGSPLIVTLSSIFGGAISGDGILEASGSGITVTLNGSLTGFTGNLLAANGGNIVLGSGTGQLNSSVALDVTNNLSTSLSYGTLNGNAANFSGGTGGTLYLTGSNGSGTLGAINMANSGTATTNTIDAGGASNTLTLGGAIASSGTANNALVLQDGTFILAATNTGLTSGGIQIGDGTGTSITQFSSASNLPGSGVGVTLNQGQLNYTGTGAVTIANAISVAGSGTTSVLTNSGTGTETLTGSIANTTAGNILAFSGGTFNLNEAGSGSGTFEIGDAPSTVIVSNANAFGSGAIIVNTGSTLETNDAVAGFGSVLAITGSSYTQNANTTLKLLATGNGVNDSIQLGSGTASLNGELNLIFSGFTPAGGQHYTAIGTTGTVTGTFSSIVLTGAPSLLGATGNYVSGTGEVIDLAYLAFFANTSSFNPNQASVANYLNTNAVSSSTPAAIQNAMIALSSLSPSQQANYLNELTPQAYSQLPQQSIQNNTFMAQQLFSQVQNAFDGGGFNTSGLMMLKTNDQDPFAVSMDAALQSAQQQARNSVAYMDNSPTLVGMPGVGPMVPTQESPLSNLSGFVLGTITVDQLQQSDTPTQNFTTGSVMAGLDYRLNRNLVIGGLFNWGYTGGTMDNVGSRQRSSSYTPGVFVGYKQGGFYADALMAYTYNSYQINRTVNMPGSSSIATGEPDSNEYDANALVGYYLPIARGLQVGPAAGAGFTQINTSGYSETGSPFDLTVAKQHADSLRSLLGMQALYSFTPGNNPLPISINFNAFWQHEFLDSARNINASFTQLGGGNFIYNTAGPSRDSALLGLGASGYITQQVSLFVNYETQVGDHRQFAQTVMAGVAISF